MPVLSYGVTGGLNLSVHPKNIADTEQTVAYNVIYEPNSGVLTTREGVSPIANKLDSPIEVLHTYVRLGADAYIMCASGSKLYYLDITGRIQYDSFGNILLNEDGTLDLTEGPVIEWTEVATLSSSRPTMLVFNGKLLVADGNESGLLSWDGTTVTRITGSPQATAIYEIRNRVAANSIASGDEDVVYLSATEDETGWTIGTDAAAAVRVGYGDGLNVNGFSAVSDTLIVSKVADVDNAAVEKKIYGVVIGADNVPSSAPKLSGVNAAIGPHALVAFQQDTHYIDAEGFESLVPVDTYGDIQNDPTSGGKVNKVIRRLVTSSDSASMCMLPAQASLYMFFSGSRRVFVYSMLTRAFTELDFGIEINYAIDHGPNSFFGGSDGQLYVYNDTATDYIYGEEPMRLTSVVRTKLIESPARSLLNKTWARVDFIDSGTIELSSYIGNGIEKTILGKYEFTAGAESSRDLFEAIEDLADADYPLFSEPERRIESYSKLSFYGLMLQVRCLGGRVIFNGIDAQVNVVGK